MRESLDALLAQLEDISALAVEQAAAGDLLEVRESIRRRGEALTRLNEVLATSPAPSYEQWNRLVIIQFQGSRVSEKLLEARARLAAQSIENARASALLHCVGGIARQPQSRIRETA